MKVCMSKPFRRPTPSSVEMIRDKDWERNIMEVYCWCEKCEKCDITGL